MPAPKRPYKQRRGRRYRVRQRVIRVLREFPNLKRADQAFTAGAAHPEVVRQIAKQLGLPPKRGGRPRKDRA